MTPTVVCHISRGLAPAIALGATAFVAGRRNLAYRIVSAMPAVDAKNEAARFALETRQNLLLIEDDITVPEAVWDRALSEYGAPVRVASALMKTGELNCWFLGERLVYAGTCFLWVDWNVLAAMPRAWFECRDMAFQPLADGSGLWIDKGPNHAGQHSDVFFFRRCWEMGIRAEVIGHATHHIHQFNAQGVDLVTVHAIKPLGLMGTPKPATVGLTHAPQVPERSAS